MHGARLRILHVIAAVAPRYGGPSKLVLEMCAALNSAGHHAEVVTSNADGEAILNQPLHRFVEYKQVRCLFFARLFGEGLKYASGMHTWLQHHVSDYDLVHIHGVFSWSSLVASNACQNRSVPYILRPLGSLDPWSMTRKSLRKKVLMRLCVRKMLYGACRIHYTSLGEQHAAEQLLDSGRGVVVPNAVDVSQFAADMPHHQILHGLPDLSGSRYILFLGRLVAKKKLELLITSFSQMQVSYDIKLIIAGSGDPDYRNKLEKLASEGPVAGQIIFLDWIEGADKTALLRDCSLFVLVSENENYGISVAEAMASGRAVVVNKGVYLCDQIQQAQAGWVIQNDSELADTLSVAMQDDAERGRRGECGRRLVINQFSWKVIVTQLEELYLACAQAE
ncbi:MAG: glycosyltransferase [bacterium]